LGFLLGYLYEPGENPIEAFALNEAIKGSSWAIVQEHVLTTNPHAKWFIIFVQGFVTGKRSPFATSTGPQATSRMRPLFSAIQPTSLSNKRDACLMLRFCGPVPVAEADEAASVEITLITLLFIAQSYMRIIHCRIGLVQPSLRHLLHLYADLLV
jgi:hypothetical protein